VEENMCQSGKIYGHPLLHHVNLLKLHSFQTWI